MFAKILLFILGESHSAEGMLIPILAIAGGLAVLVWSADKFVEGASIVARHLGMPPLLIGMLIVGFGTSAPELTVSAFAAASGNPGIALGNAFGSNIANIALILGITALICPITAHSSVLRKELPILAAVTALVFFLLADLSLSRLESWALLAVFAALIGWAIWQATNQKDDPLALEFERELEQKPKSIGAASLWLGIGLLLLIGSSRLMVWGAVSIAQGLGVSDLVIGLTVVAIGTSLPELASSIVAARKGEHDIALGNILGSNLFNTLAVVGLAGVIRPIEASADVLSRDLPFMAVLTLSLFAICYRPKGHGRINRFEAIALLLAFVGYNIWIFNTA